ncbi:unnamed protein product [Oikopleura dioica]|uniref:Reverse transcriptase domain-containing protein n=1 Tax=Oikopleura dioica TaxID=34765 RepID=E4Y9D9_OIKDI|nr:unnamed protein product [Oikopleura dioica]
MSSASENLADQDAELENMLTDINRRIYKRDDDPTRPCLSNVVEDAERMWHSQPTSNSYENPLPTLLKTDPFESEPSCASTPHKKRSITLNAATPRKKRRKTISECTPSHCTRSITRRNSGIHLQQTSSTDQRHIPKITIKKTSNPPSQETPETNENWEIINSSEEQSSPITGFSSQIQDDQYVVCDSWDSEEDVDRHCLFADATLLKKLKPHIMDSRTQEAFIADMKKVSDIFKTKSKSEKQHRPVRENDEWLRLSCDRYSHLANTDFKEITQLIEGPLNRALTIREFIENSNLSFLPQDFREYCKLVTKAVTKRTRLNNWFAQKKGTRWESLKDAYLSNLVHLGCKSIFLLEQAISGNVPQALLKSRMASQSKKTELETFLTNLKTFASYINNKNILRELYLTKCHIIYLYVPAPPSEELMSLLFDFIFPKMQGRVSPIKSVKTLIVEKAREMGLILRHRKRNFVENRYFIADKNPSPEQDVIPPPIGVLQVKTFIKLIPVNIQKILKKTIINMVVLNTNFEPDQVDFSNLDNVFSDNKGRKILNSIVIYLNASPYNYIHLIQGNDLISSTLAPTANRIFSKTKGSMVPKTKNQLESEAQIRSEITNGIVPTKALPGQIPSPLYLLETQTTAPSKKLKDLKAKVGRIIYNIKGNSTVPKKDNETNDTNSKTNPSNEDIKDLQKKCEIMNLEQVSKNRNLSILSTNPGLLESHTFRDIVDFFPNNDFILVNELRASQQLMQNHSTWAPGYEVFYNNNSPDKLSYTAIAVKSESAHLCTKLPDVGTTTTILITFGNNNKLQLSAVYRNIEKYNENCFYKKFFNGDLFVFVEWMNQLCMQAKQKRAKSIIAGDMNIQMLNCRTEDNKKLAEALLKVFKNHVNAIKYPTNFRPGCKPSTIDYFMIQDPRRVEVKALGMHRPPLSFDGHTGHIIKMPVTGWFMEYEVRVSDIVDMKSLATESIIRNEGLQCELARVKDPEIIISRTFSVINDIINSHRKKVAKIQPKITGNVIKRPLDTKTYHAAINLLTEEREKGVASSYFSEAELFSLNKSIRDISIIIRKLQKRDSDQAFHKITEDCNDSNTAAWKIIKELTAKPPVRKLTEDVEQLMTQVVDLQKKTTLDPKNYTGHSFKPRHKVKLDKFTVSVHGKNGNSSIWAEYKGLKHFTKGSTGIGRGIVDSFHVSTFYDLIAKPIILAIENGIYPSAWRTNRTAVLPKTSGIRPISISEIFASILEKLIINEINEYLEFNHILPTEQNGFRSSMSTGTSIGTVNKYIAESLDKGEYVVICAIDMRNAFGTPPHKNLMKCLSKLFSGTALKILCESLERWAIVSKDGMLSRKEKMEAYGVPQGSVCSPSIFCVYISEILNCVSKSESSIKFSIFADDTIVLCRKRTLDEAKQLAEQTLDRIGIKLMDMGLQIVPSKTSILIASPKNIKETDHYIRVLNTNVNVTTQLKYLGSTMETVKGMLSYQTDAELKISKIKNMINQNRSIQHYIGRKSSQTMLRSYCIGVYNHNIEILPKWKGITHLKCQRTYGAGLDNRKNIAWYLKNKNEVNKEGKGDLEAIRTITKSGHPTLFECQLSLFHAQIHKTWRFRKNEVMFEDLSKALKIVCSQNNNIAVGFVDIFGPERDLVADLYFETKFGIAAPGRKHGRELFCSVIKMLILNENLELLILPDKYIGKHTIQLTWPYNLYKEYNQLPTSIRKSVLTNKYKKDYKNYATKRHKHLHNVVNCAECKSRRALAIPSYIEYPTITEFDSTMEAQQILDMRTEDFQRRSGLPKVSTELAIEDIISDNLYPKGEEILAKFKTDVDEMAEWPRCLDRLEKICKTIDDSFGN